MRRIGIFRLLAYITAITMLAALALPARTPAQELKQEPPRPVLLSIAVTPADASILPDRVQRFAAMGTYSDGSTHDLTWSVTWSSSVLDVATINRVGVATALAVGQTTIEAALGAINGSATLNVVLRGTFDLTGSMETGRYVHTATLLNNGMVLMAGGCCLSQFPFQAELYNPATGSFTPTGSMNARVLGDAAKQRHGADCGRWRRRVPERGAVQSLDRILLVHQRQHEYPARLAHGDIAEEWLGADGGRH